MNDKSCSLTPKNQGTLEEVRLCPENGCKGYQQALQLAQAEAERRFADFMLISWYARDRDFESPPNTTECGAGCPKNGYINYGLSHGAALKVDVENGRFVFFYSPVEW